MTSSPRAEAPANKNLAAERNGVAGARALCAIVVKMLSTLPVQPRVGASVSRVRPLTLSIDVKLAGSDGAPVMPRRSFARRRHWPPAG
jgi:hypothetical protein